MTKDETQLRGTEALNTLAENMAAAYAEVSARVVEESVRTGSSVYHVSWGEDAILVDGPLQVRKPRTRRERLADWWEYRVLDMWFDLRRRVGWAIVEFGERAGRIDAR